MYNTKNVQCTIIADKQLTTFNMKHQTIKMTLTSCVKNYIVYPAGFYTIVFVVALGTTDEHGKLYLFNE